MALLVSSSTSHNVLEYNATSGAFVRLLRNIIRSMVEFGKTKPNSLSFSKWPQLCRRELLMRIARYEQRALSCRKFAIREPDALRGNSSVNSSR